MYNSYMTTIDNTHHGSTQLHQDLTDALNLMVWTAGTIGAVWHIFLPEDTAKVTQFIEDNTSLCGYDPTNGHPIHSQQVYLTPFLLNLLFVNCNVRPFVIFQLAGHIVVIPAGCLHQVGLWSSSFQITTTCLKHTRGGQSSR